MKLKKTIVLLSYQVNEVSLSYQVNAVPKACTR